MIFNVPQLISYMSHMFVLLPGDVIATGTPPGVGAGIKPEPIFLKPGNVMRLGIDGWASSARRSWPPNRSLAPSQAPGSAGRADQAAERDLVAGRRG